MFATSAVTLCGLSAAVLGWRPAEFWAATPAELAAIMLALTQHQQPHAPPSRGTIAELMEQFPDE